MAKKQDLYIDQGATWRMHADFTDSNGNAINLTGYTARMYIKRSVTATAAILQLTTENGRISIPTPSNGGIDFVIADEDTAALFGTYCYDIELVSAGGEVYRVSQGKFVINPEVTR